MNKNNLQITFYEFIQNMFEYEDLLKIFLKVNKQLTEDIKKILTKKINEISILIELEKYQNKDFLKNIKFEDEEDDVKVNMFYYYKYLIKKT